MSMASRGPTETVSLDDAVGRVLAEPVLCDIDYPPFDKSMMDGFAVRSGDAADGATLSIVGQIAAGSWRSAALEANQAVQINTGAPLPPGADAVIPVEKTSVSGDALSLRASVNPEQHVTRRGAYVSAGDAVLGSGLRMGPVEIGVAATSGAASLTVVRRPTISIMGTGDELIDVSDRPKPGQIRNSNSPMMRALVRQAGGVCDDIGVVCDDRRAIDAAIERGLTSDFLCLSGGISMGAFDFVPDALRQAGVEFVVKKVAMKPGKPTIVGRHASGCLVFALPGNPLSTFVGFWLFVRPAIDQFLGLTGVGNRWIGAKLVAPLAATGPRECFWPATIGLGDDGGLCVEKQSWAGSGDLFGFAGADALIRQPANSGEIPAGHSVRVLQLERF